MRVWNSIVGSGKVGELRRDDGVIVSRIERVVVLGGVRRISIVSQIILVVIDEMTGAPFDNETPSLDKGLSFVLGERFNASDASIGDWNDSPLVTRNACTGSKRKEIIVAGGVAGWRERDSAKRAGLRGIGRVRWFKNLYILAKLNAHTVVIRGRGASDDRERAGIARDAVAPRKLVETAHGVGNDVNDEQLGNALEWKPVNGGTEAFLDSFDRTFHFANMAVRRNNVHVDGPDLLLDALKFLVGVDVNDGETAGAVEVDDEVHFAKNRVVGPIRYRGNRSKTDGTGDRVEEWMSLNKEKINAKRDLAVVFENTGRNRNRLVGGNTLGCTVMCHLAF